MRLSSWFRGVVVVGLASAPACGGRVVEPGGSTGGAGGTGGYGTGGYGTGGYGTGGYGTGGYGTGGYGTGGYGTGGYGTGGYGTGGYGTGGYGTGGYGGGISSPTLGATCTTDFDCGTGLTCYAPTSNAFGTGGPAQGYCSRPCTQNPDCQKLDSTAQCVKLGSGKAFCLEGCDPTSAAVCQGRYDSLCMPQQLGADAGYGGPAVCMPYCGSDNDCAGLKCDLRTGLCTSNPTTGKAMGAPCNPQAATDPCAGFCIGDDPNDGTKGICSAYCSNNSLGVAGECGSNAQQGSPQDAACLFQATFPSGGTVGICGQLCNCDNDCRGSGQVCESWAAAGVSNPSQFVQAFHEAGLCVPASGFDGGVVAGTPCP